MPELPNELVQSVPDALRNTLTRDWEHWVQACTAHNLPIEFSAAAGYSLRQLGKLWACSEFAARLCQQYPAALHALIAEDITRARSLAQQRVQVGSCIAAVVASTLTDAAQHEAALMRELRQLRQREMLRIALRDIGELATLAQILIELSDFAEAVVSETLPHLHALLAQNFGEPRDSHGDVQQLLVLGMGKLGGHELNFSSDIDLIFAYAEGGQTAGARSLSHQEFFLRLAQKLIRVLSEVTADGFVFRVDARLRPFGDSGPLVASFAALEQYYQAHGRDWERYAMIKARAVAGRAPDIAALQQLLRPFIYRRYLDYSALASIREMKAMIVADMRQKGMRDNVKLGEGGIREIEFIGQTLQLIRGGRESRLQLRGILPVLTELVALGHLDAAQAAALVAAYGFLRRLENRMQMLRDQQTHDLPGDELDRARLTLAMDMSDWPVLEAELGQHRDRVSAIFRGIVAAPTPPAHSALLLFWLHSERAEALHGWLRELGYLDTEAVLALLASFVNHAQVRRLSEAAATRLQKLLASLLAETVVYPQPAALLARILDTLRALAGRTVYIDLLLEYPGVRTHMLQLCAASDWFAQQLASTPLLLDAMLDSASFYRKSQHAELEQSLHYLLSAVDADLEQQMERLRQFKHAEQLKLAAQDVSGKVDVMDVGDVLSDIAAVVLKTTLALAWQSTAAVHGEPVCGAPEARYRPRMAVIGYGKLGGRELGYSSDLDIVFIHNGVAENAYTDGDKVIDNSNFFARVAQRVLHILGTRTYAGLLYETDTRLRPDGRAGLMVSSTAGFEDYQRNKAWTWEHQALVRARVVAGDAPVREEFARIRHAVLARQRSAQTLLSEVLAMRLKMRDHLASGAVDAVNLKQDAGGIVDIEFIAQAGVLLHAAHHATLLSSTSTLQLLRILGGTGWLRAHEVAALASAYTCYRGQLNREALQIADAAADASNISGHRDAVSAVWERVFAGLVPAQL